MRVLQFVYPGVFHRDPFAKSTTQLYLYSAAMRPVHSDAKNPCETEAKRKRATG